MATVSSSETSGKRWLLPGMLYRVVLLENERRFRGNYWLHHQWDDLLMMATVRSSETSGNNYLTTRINIPKEDIFIQTNDKLVRPCHAQHLSRWPPKLIMGGRIVRREEKRRFISISVPPAAPSSFRQVLISQRHIACTQEWHMFLCTVFPNQLKQNFAWRLWNNMEVIKHWIHLASWS
jgi:hypothetical protein